MLQQNAVAGAWLQPKGKSEMIVQYEYKFLDSYYTNNDNIFLSKKFCFENYHLFYQYGYKDDINFGFETKWMNYKGYTQFLENNSENYNFFQENELMYDDRYKKFENQIEEFRVFIQKELWSAPGEAILSIQPGFRSYNYNYDHVKELNALYGYSFKVGTKNAYINIETGIGWNQEHVLYKLNSSFGIYLSEKNLTIFEYLFSTNNGLDKDEDVTMGKISWIYKYNSNIYWQNSYSTNVNNRHKYIVDSFMTGIWIKF
jgi:hypothetical protein